MRAIILTSLLALLFGLFSCSPQWHLRRAYAKDPALSRLDTTTTITRQATPTVSGLVNLFEIAQRPVFMEFPRTYQVGTRTITDTVKLSLTAADSASILASVECPPVQVVEREIKVPHYIPVEKKQPFWNKLFIALALILAIIVASKYTKK